MFTASFTPRFYETEPGQVGLLATLTIGVLLLALRRGGVVADARIARFGILKRMRGVLEPEDI